LVANSASCFISYVFRTRCFDFSGVSWIVFVSPPDVRMIAIFLSEIFSSVISRVRDTVYWSGLILPDTIPSPCPRTASIRISSLFLTGWCENMTPDLSEFIIFWTMAAMPTSPSNPFFFR